jgi:N-acetylneuraminic acid mutarotase
MYAIGGLDAQGNRLGAVEAYDPRTNTWQTRAPIPIPRAHPAVGTLSDGQIIVAGGGLKTHAPLANVELYTPATNAWQELTPILQASAGGPTGEVVDGDEFYVIGGFTGTSLDASTFVESTTVR